MTPTSKTKSTLLWVLLGVAVLAVLSTPFVTSSDSRAPAPPPRDDWAAYSASVTSGPFNVDVMLHARLEAGQSVTLSSGLPSNMAKILELAPDGSYLRKGELVARFDRRPLDEGIRKLNSELRDAQTQLQQLRADYSLMASEGQERSAQLAYSEQVAEAEMQQLLEVELPSREARAVRDYRKAVANHDALKAKHATQLELVDKGLGTRVDLGAAEAALREADAELAIVRGELEGLRTVTLPAERQHARLKAANANREHLAYEATLSQRLQKHTGSIRRAENKLLDLEEELAEAQDHLALTELRAPVTGILLHRRVSAGLEKRKPQVGDSLWKGHAFAVIPDMSSMIAEAAVSEREVGKLAVGQAVQLVPDAYPDLVLRGSVASIGTLVESDRGEPQFSVRIGLDSSDERLRPGMSGRVAVRTAALDYALRIPIQAVFIDELKPVGFRLHGGDVSRVDLVLGPSDGKDVVVSAGLERGDHVLMVYPETLQ